MWTLDPAEVEVRKTEDSAIVEDDAAWRFRFEPPEPGNFWRGRIKWWQLREQGS